MFVSIFVLLALATTSSAVVVKKEDSVSLTTDGNVASAAAPAIVANLNSVIVKVNETVDIDISVIFSSTETLTYYQTGLPNGTTLDSASGQITGNPLVVGVYRVSPSAADGTSTALGNAFSIIVTYSDGTYPSPTHSPLPSGVFGPVVQQVLDNEIVVVNTTFSINCGASFSDANLEWFATGLPDGVSMDSTSGIISGAASTEGMYHTIVEASVNGSLRTKSSPFFIIVCDVDGDFPQ